MLRFRLKELISDKQFNEGRRVTLGEVSEATGIHRATLSKIANHQGYNATADVIDRLCTYFEVPIQDLVTHVPDRDG